VRHKPNAPGCGGAITLLMLCAELIACGAHRAPVAIPQTSPALPVREPPPAAEPTSRVEAPATIEQPIPKDDIDGRTLDELNRDSPFGVVFFGHDSAELEIEARSILDAAADVLKTHPSWIVAIEGHCDERGTAEYNLALGERRATAVEVYLVSVAKLP
jgi:peptidoglycan-associated lipoprotein